MPNLSRIQRNVALPLVIVAAVFGFYWLGDQRARAAVNGPSPSFTGAPGETNCTECHNSFVVNSGGGNVSITGLPTNYRPNQTFAITVTVNHDNAVIYGFQLTSLDGQGRQAGTLFPVAAPTPEESQVVQGIINGNIRDYIEHTVNSVLPTQFDTKSWTFNWKAPATRVGRITLYAAGNGANSDSSPVDDYIYTTSKNIYSHSALADFDGDGESDISVYRPSNGGWYRINSSNNGFIGVAFGLDSDMPVPGDFDGDGKHDIAVFRPSNGGWYVLNSSNGAFRAEAWGTSGDVPLIMDYDGDGKSDLAVYRPSNGSWYFIKSSNGAFEGVQFGALEDKPVPGDYDADGKTDIAVYRPSSGSWYLLRSTLGFTGIAFGVSDDKPVPGDYDGDGTTDVALYRPSAGAWYLLRSNGGFIAHNFGISTDQPAPGDFDGDGVADITVYRDGTWYIQLSTNGSWRIEQFGSTEDIPLPATYIPENEP